MKSQQRPTFLLSLLTAFSLFFHHHTQPILAAVEYSTSTTTTPPTSVSTSTNATDFIRTSCTTTLYPDLCYISLSRYAAAVQQDSAHLAKLAISVSLKKAQRMAIYVSKLSRQADYGSDHRAASALHDCFTSFGDAVDQIRGSIKQMRRLGTGGPKAGATSGGGESLRFQLSNVQTWMSAALTNEDTCTDGFEDVTDGPMKTDVCDRVTNVKKFTSNALALVNSYVAKSAP